MTSVVLVALRVQASPERAFDVFTGEIAEWWRPDPLFAITPRGDGLLAFDGEEGGRLVARFPDGTIFEIGRVTEWRRGERLAFEWRQAGFATDLSTRVEVTFAAFGTETRVTVRHFGWTEIPRRHAARHGFPDHITQLRAGEWWQKCLESFARRAT
ncbi:MAG TPA: SRPBCC domain-containing protein [Vicinamibacteria bacterium]|nr:SRPBCC domain-containing protein [Vicinamibacteria bacterium]